MAKNNDGLSSLIRQLSTLKVDGLTVSNLLAPVNLLNPAHTSSKSMAKVSLLHDTKALSLNANDIPSGIKFGKSSGTRTPGSGSSNHHLTDLLKQTASGGISSALGSGLGSIAGLGGLVSGIISLFGGGGKQTPPPLVEFQLPQSQQETVYVNSKTSTTYQGTNIEHPSVPAPGQRGGIYGQANATSSGQILQYQSSQIAQAVKNALLNSSSLNDVIAEI